MDASAFLLLGSAYLAASTATLADCSSALTEQIWSAQRVVESLRPGKAGNMREYASNGSQYTEAQAAWLRSQMRLVLHACASGDEKAGASALRGIVDLLTAARKAS